MTAADAHGTASMMRDGVVLLGAALVFVLIFRRLGLGATLGYLVAGMAIGPWGLGLVGDPQAKMAVAELGITLLLFLVGIELAPGRLWRLKRDIFGLGLAQVLLAGGALCLFLYLARSLSPGAAITLGLPLALSSTAQVLPMLNSAGRLHTPFGERAFSILLLQDLSIVPLITIVAALSRVPPGAPAAPGWLLGVYTVLAVAGLVLAGRYAITPLFRLIGGLGERELFVAAGLFTVLAAATVMQWLGLSTALGAFVAGVMLADSPYRHELEADIEPFRTILLGLFFVTVGMMLDLGVVAARPLVVLGLAAGVVALKTGVLWGIARLWGMGNRQALELGLLLSQGGEFGFVLFAQAASGGLVRPEAASLFGAVVTVSMATTPFLMMFSRRFAAPPSVPRDDLDGPDAAAQASALVIGYGRFGQTVAQMLLGAGISVTIVDKDPEMIDVAGSFGMKVYYGDWTRLDLLRTAGAGDARLIVFCLDDGDAQLGPERLGPVLETFAHAAVLARVYDRRTLIAYRGLELSGTVRELFESAVCMGRAALERIGVPDETVDVVEAAYRERDRDRLAAQSEAGDIYAARDAMIRQTLEDRARGEATA